jgi:protoheme ferro-lyase
MGENPATARRSPWAVLLLAYGGPRRIEDVEPFLRRIMRPGEPSPEIVARAVERYRAIGGGSPLLDNTVVQADALGPSGSGRPPRHAAHRPLGGGRSR